MKTAAWSLLIALVPAAGVAVGAAPARTIEFHQSIEEARKGAKPERPMVILFGAAWCTWCHKMESDTLADAKVATVAAQFAWVKIDVDKNQELAARYGVDGVPVTVVVDKQGRVLGQHSGYMPAARFVEFLSTSLANPHPEELLPDLLKRFAKSHGPAEERQAIEQLVEQLAKPARPDRDEILAALRQKGPAIWPVIVDFMGDDRLAVRAAAAGALKHACKAGLSFEPFAETPLRQQQIAGWRKWLAAHPSGS